MSVQRVARVAATLCAIVAVLLVAAALGATWDPFTLTRRASGAPDPGGFGLILLVPAAWHALVACAYLARAGEGPLRAAPRSLVGGVGWLASAGAALSVAGSVGAPVTLPLALWTVTTAGIALFGFTTMWLTRARAGGSRGPSPADRLPGPAPRRR